ncbi:hypothetical protein [Tannerella sp.]|uniref:hypothetical protein n=1 Tax=Tannerella sp. TaxID=2382127 RepID=UPI0026DC89D2|nr:hypothetical protein [Tannerella sp.]MDO4702525.1 hypothetical protein [Tannerella sp.]
MKEKNTYSNILMNNILSNVRSLRMHSSERKKENLPASICPPPRLHYLTKISLRVAAFSRGSVLEHGMVALRRPEDSCTPTRSRLKTTRHWQDAKKHRVKRSRFQALRAGVPLPSTDLLFLPTEVPLNATKLFGDLTQVPFFPPMFWGDCPEEPEHRPELRGRPTKLAWKRTNLFQASPKLALHRPEAPLNATSRAYDYTDARLVRTNVPLLQRTFRENASFYLLTSLYYRWITSVVQA